jgi:hypothetical protein
LIIEAFEESRKFSHGFGASLHQLKLVLKLKFSSLRYVRERGFKSSPGLMCMFRPSTSLIDSSGKEELRRFKRV